MSYEFIDEESYKEIQTIEVIRSIADIEAKIEHHKSELSRLVELLDELQVMGCTTRLAPEVLDSLR